MKKLLIILVVCLLLSGCSETVSMENLLMPPKMSAEQNEIYRELINSAGQDVKLKYPKSGEYRSAFVVRDIDNDPGNEAMVFYESKNVQSGESALRLKFLDQSGGKWQAVYDLACPGSEVENISFVNMSASNRIDILICYTMLGKTEKVFSVLNYADKIPVELYSAPYSILEVTDLNADGEDELIVVNTDKANQTASVSMLKNTDEGFKRLSETELNGYGFPSEFLRVTKGKIDEKTDGIFLDYSIGKSNGLGMSSTSVLFCYGNNLGCIAMDPRYTNDYTPEIYSTDIDGDGIIEIPTITRPLPGYETLASEEMIYAVRWVEVENAEAYRIKMDHYSVYSGKFRFALFFPDRWQGVVTAIPDFNNNEIVFISYNTKTGLNITPETELMRIRAVDKDDTSAVDAVSAQNEFRLLAENDEMAYYISETNGYRTGKLALTESELKYNFIMLK